MQLRSLLLSVAFLVGCDSGFPRKVRVIKVNPGAGYDNTNIRALRVRNTVIEDERGFRSIVPGCYGEPGDEFFLAEQTNEIGGE